MNFTMCFKKMCLEGRIKDTGNVSYTFEYEMNI